MGETFYYVSHEKMDYRDWIKYEYDADGKVLLASRVNGPLYLDDDFQTDAPYRAIFDADGNYPVFEADLLENSVFNLDGDHKPISVKTAVNPDPPPEPELELEPTPLYLHVVMTDGDGREPVGLLNDGIDSISIVATFRVGEASDSTVITSISNTWRVTIREDGGSIYDIILITFVNGIATVTYKTTASPDICDIREEDMDLITMGDTTYRINIVGNTQFKVFRSL